MTACSVVVEPKEASFQQATKQEQESAQSNSTEQVKQDMSNMNQTQQESSTPITRIYVTNMPYSASWQDLKDLVRDYVGTVGHVELFTDATGRSRGSALVDFAQATKPSDAADEDAVLVSTTEAVELVEKAIEALNEVQFRGRALLVRADTKPEQPARRTFRRASNYDQDRGSMNSFQTVPSSRYSGQQNRMPQNAAKSNERVTQRYQADAYDADVKPRQATDSEYKRDAIETTNAATAESTQTTEQTASEVKESATPSSHENMIHISNLAYRTSWQDLKDLCMQFGRVIRVDVATDRVSGRSRGFGSARFASKQDANKAIEKINEMEEFQGRKLIAKHYQWREYK